MFHMAPLLNFTIKTLDVVAAYIIIARLVYSIFIKVKTIIHGSI